MSRITEFYQGTGADSEGRSLEDIWNFSDEEMEFHHDFIQWMFPLETLSRFNRSAPVLTETDIRAFQDDPKLRENLRKSLDRFLAFLGLTREGDHIVPAADFPTKQAIFMEPDHNWLRITRALSSLRILGLAEEAERFHEGLQRLILTGKARVTTETRAFWRNAAFP